MTSLRLLALLIPAVASIAGCGEGYVVEPAQLNILGEQNYSVLPVLAAASRILKPQGFEDFGKYTAMIALIEHSQMPATVKQQELSRLQREYTFLNDAKHLRIEITDYSSGVPGNVPLTYTALSTHFVEIDILDERPGGFSPDGLRFYARFLSDLKQEFGSSVVVVKAPPPTNESEYKRITITNLIAGVFAWFLVFAASFPITGLLSYFVLKRIALPKRAKRGIFIAANSWLAAPILMQGGFVFVLPVPNLFAFPWTDWDLYLRNAHYVVVSFSTALVICIVMSTRLYNGQSRVQPLGT